VVSLVCQVSKSIKVYGMKRGNANSWTAPVAGIAEVGQFSYVDPEETKGQV